MSAPKKEITNLSENGVVTEAALLAYLNNELPADKKQELEKLLQEDPFAQEALEGLQSAHNKLLLASSISSLNKKVRERTGVKEAKMIKLHWSNYAWAAAVFAILLGIGFVMVNLLGNKNEHLAANEKPVNKEQPVNIVEHKETTKQEAEQKPSAAMPTMDSVAVAMQGKAGQNAITPAAGTFTVTIDDKNKTQAPVMAGAKPDVSAKPASTTAAAPAAAAQTPPALKPAAPVNSGAPTGVTVNNNSTPGISANNKLFYSNSTLTASNNGIGNATNNGLMRSAGTGTAATGAVAGGKAKEEIAKDKVVVSDANRGTPAKYERKEDVPPQTVIRGAIVEKVESDKPVVVTNEEAMKTFNSGDYKKASEQFDKILKQDPENADALYFGGISDYIDGKTAKSEKSFDKILKKGAKFTDGAKWYKANILIKDGHRDQAKALLQDLINSGGSYKERAVKKMADITF